MGLMLAAALLAAAAAFALPRAIEAASLLAAADDPAALADHRLGERLDAATARNAIEAALADGDADLAQSILDLALERGMPVEPPLAAKVAAATARANSAAQTAENFARGLLLGEPEDLAGLAGTAVGDLFVLGDLRDAIREGGRLASGTEPDYLILGLAGLGLAVTAGTYATLGTATPVRLGLSAAKAARRTGRLNPGLADWLGRSLRDVVDWPRLGQALAGASLARPAGAIRAAQEAVRLEKAGAVVDLLRTAGTVQTRAGTRAALDALRAAENPVQLARIAKLAEKKGGKTRAILKLLGAGALVVTAGTFQLAQWLLWLLLALVGCAAALKTAAEQTTRRLLAWRKRRLAARLQALRNERLAAVALGRLAQG